MPKRILDTNVLIDHFGRPRPLSGRSAADAESHARGLIADKGADAIVAAVEVEFLCIVMNDREKVLREAYLGVFKVIDDHRTLPQDWAEARRLAKHPGHRPKERDLGDCLIFAIADRLHCDVITFDRGAQRQHGRTRQRRD